MKVHHKENAAGCDIRLLNFLDWWEENGPFEITVCPDGGVRLDEEKQKQFFMEGHSKAETLASTPHGRAGALDAAPMRNGEVDWKDAASFKTMGLLAEAHGLQWGGRFPRPDSDHIQVPNWRQLPYPPAIVPVSTE